MPSPFPGMNPYLEQEDAWHQFHKCFPLPVIAQLTVQVDPRYIVKTDEHVYLHELSAAERRPLVRPDKHVLLPSVDEERQPFIEIRDRVSREVVTVIELLSPTNKYAGSDREQYLGKRAVLLKSRTNLVEIDLLRGGPRLPHYGNVNAEYAALIYRAHEWPRAGALPIRLHEPLPLIPIPLSPPDPDVYLDLKAVIDRIHDEARYATYIYQGQPKPALSPEDAAWAQQFVPPPVR